MSAPLLAVEHLCVRHGATRVVEDVSFTLARGETLAVVGESGAGKTTLARAVLGLVPIESGRVAFDGTDLATLDAAGMRTLRRRMQVVFQDPLSSLDPRMTVHDSVAEPLWTHEPALPRADVTRRVAAMFERVGLSRAQLDRYPHELSGGQCQRVGIARALVLGPELVVCDEPVSALDVSVQAQVLDLLVELKRELELAMLFISHDLAVVHRVADRVLVMRAGRVVEIAPRDELYSRPAVPYTRELLDAMPVAPPRRPMQTREPLDQEPSS